MTTVGGQEGHLRDELGRPPNPISVFLVAGLVALVLSVVAVTGATSGRFVSILRSRLSGQVTVIVSGQGLESADAAAALAAELLAGQAGVRRATVLEASEDDATVSEIIAGPSFGPEETRLVSVSGAPDVMPSTSSFRRLLAARQLKAVIDDHRRAGGPLENRMLIAAGAGFSLCVALVGSLFAVCLIAGSRVVRAASGRFNLITRLGADPAFVGAMVGRRMGLMALAGGVVGSVCADLIVFAAMRTGGLLPGFTGPAFAPQIRDGVWTVAPPIIVMVVAALAGGLGAARAIARRERLS